jgi:hypothetical protein
MKRLLILIALIVIFFGAFGQFIASGQFIALGQSKKTCQEAPTYFGIAGVTN